MFIEVRGSFVGIPSNQHRASISLASVSPSCLTTQQTSDRSLKSARLRVKFTEQNGADHDAVEAAHAPGIRFGHHDGIACGVCALAARRRLHLRPVPQPDDRQPPPLAAGRCLNLQVDRAVYKPWRNP